MTKNIYRYHPITREFLGAGEADESPLDPGQFLLPAFATAIAPPPAGARQVAVFEPDSGAWACVDDFRGVPLYSTADGSVVEVASVGPMPADTTTEARPSCLHEWIGEHWVLNIDRARAEVWQAIKAERDRRRFEGGVKVVGHWYLSTAIAAGEYNSLALMSAGLPDTTVLRADWRTMDGAKVDMTPALVKQVLAAGFAQVAAIDDAAQAHRTAMETSADPAAYDYSGGWPLTYADELAQQQGE